MNEIENINKIKNTTILNFLKTSEIRREKNSIKLIDFILNFPIEKYMIKNEFLSNIKKELYKKYNKNSSDQECEKDALKFIDKKNTKDFSDNNSILFKFEEDFIKKSIKDSFKSTDFEKSTNTNNKKVNCNKKISVYKFQNKREAALINNIIYQNNYNEINKEKLILGDKLKLNDNNNLEAQDQNHKYYIKLLNQQRDLQKINNFQHVNLQIELKIINLRIREKRIAKIKNFINKIRKILNIKSFLDLKNTKNTIQATFSVLSKYIALYKLSMNELVEGQREVTHNKNFRFEDGETVQEKIENFERKLKENVNLNDHYEKKEKI
jgi:hypothetical protein